MQLYQVGGNRGSGDGEASYLPRSPVAVAFLFVSTVYES